MTLPATKEQTMANNLIPVSDIEKMAIAFAKSKLFGIKTPEEAMALMLIAQAEGNHPAIAARDYHIIQGKPALKADAMLSRFQGAGGKVQWHDMTDSLVSATFSHPSGGTVKIDWDMKRAKQAQLGSNGMWNKYPRQMLRARVISEGIRTVFPGVIVGSYTPEEVQDFATIDSTATELTGDSNTPDLSKLNVHSEDGMTQEQKKALYEEAEQALEAVSTMDDYNSWVVQYDAKCRKHISKARYKPLEERANAVGLTLSEKGAV